jgi:histidinol-phosphate aminotransferase
MRPEPARVVAGVPAARPFVGPEELARRVGRRELIRLGANESAFGPPPAALAAMRAELARASWYGDPECADLRAALAARHGVDPAEIVVGSGIDELLGLIVRAYLGDGEVAAATHGTYPTFTYHVAGHGSRVATVPYRDDGYVDLPALAALARRESARIVYLANPDNPSGTRAAVAEFAAFLEAIPARSLVILDEAYADFVAPEDLAGPNGDPRVVRMRTFSKAYGLAGARIGYALAPRETIATLGKIRNQYGVNRIAQSGALAALDEPEFIAGVVAEVARGRAEYAALGARLGMRTLPSETNFVCFEIGSPALAEAMVEGLLESGIFIRKPGAPPLEGFIRVSVGAAAERAAFAQAFGDLLAAQASLR